MEKVGQLGNKLLNLCKKGNKEVILVAPFIKVKIINLLLSVISENIILYCITRWRPDEIAFGVSDIEVWNDIKDRENSYLLLCSNLHAKYYRADNNCLIGSANLTEKALGVIQPNLELLFAVPYNEYFLQFEENIFLNSINVNEQVYLEMFKCVKLLEHEFPNMSNQDKDIKNSLIQHNLNYWLPTLRNPEELYIAYSDNLEKLSPSAQISAKQDLYYLNIPPGFSRKTFEAYVGILLLQHPILKKIDNFLDISRRFGAIRNYVISLSFAEREEADRITQTILRWFMYFLPRRYERFVPNFTEVFKKKKE